MIVAMENHATEEQLEAVIERMVELGFNVHRTTGAAQTILAGVGTPRYGALVLSAPVLTLAVLAAFDRPDSVAR